MSSTKKKKYEKPEVRKVDLDGRTSVLAVCKAGVFGQRGPNTFTCKRLTGNPCLQFGS